MFGRHSATAAAPGDTIVEERNGTVTSVDDSAVDDSAVDDSAVDERTVDEPAVDRTERISTAPKPVVVAEPVATDEPVAVDEPVVVEPVKTGWAHVSILASLSLIVGTLAVAATLTGLLAPIGFAAGILAVILGAVASLAIKRPNVTGHGIVLFGVLFGLVAAVLSALAIGGQLSWLSNKTDEIAVVHSWLNDHLHWLRRW